LDNFGLELIECYFTKANPADNPFIKNEKVSTGHSHNYFQYVYILEDTFACLKIEDEKFNLKKDNIYLIKPHSIHSFELSQNTISMLECKFFTTNKEFLDILNFLPNELSCPNDKILNILKEIINELNDRNFKDSYIYLKLYEMILLLNRIKLKEHNILNNGMPKSGFEEFKKNKFDNLIEFIKNNYYDSELTIEDFASIVHLEKTYFSKAFKKVYNTSPMQYLNLLRLQYALNLLEYTNESINEIANKVGFKSFNAFISAFKKTYKISPKDYRKKIKAKIKEKYDNNQNNVFT
jgi:AraC-like DNA-binding protein